MRIEVSVSRLCLLILTSALVRTQASSFYVSTQGSDGNPGTAAQPFRTISHAYSLAAPGVTILVLPGVYSDYSSGWGLHLGASGSASSPIVLRSQVKGGAVIDGQNASDRNEAIYLDGSYNIVDGFEIRNGPNGGISIHGNSNQIINNEIHHNGNPASTSTNGKDGVYSGENTSGNYYAANFIHDNGRPASNLDHGLYLCGKNETVINNVLVRNSANGLQIAGYTTVSTMKIYNNVMAWNGTCGIILWQALSGVDIRNNILYQNGHYGIGSWDAHGNGVVVDHNLSFGNGYGNYDFSGGGSDYSYTPGTTIQAAPLFVNSTSAGFDAHLGAGSPAINAGLNLSSFFGTDKDGAARPGSGAWDLGAYRSGTTDTTLPTVTLSAPANNATVSGPSVSVSASATDNVGVAGVQFKLDGANLGGEDTSAPYGITWNTTTVANGAHTLGAVARDAAGNQISANSVSVVVSNSAPTSLPTVTITSSDTTMTEGTNDMASFTLTRTGSTASDLTLTLAPGGTATKWDDFRRPVEGDMPDTWIIPAGASSVTITVMAVADNIVEGTETAALTIQASSNYNVGTPSSVTFTILDSNGVTPPGDIAPPTVSMTAPANNATASGSAVTVSATASDNVGVAGVQFKLDGANLGGEYTNAPYSLTWNTTTVADGAHAVTAVARDAAGNQSTATPVIILVSNTVPITLPTITVAATDASSSRIGPDNGVFTITRTGSTASALTVDYSLGGTAANGTDYNTPGTSATIPSGANATAITIVPAPATYLVGSKTVTLSLSANAAYTVGASSSATLDIAGNVVPIRSIKATGANVTVTWASASGKTYRVAYKNSVTDPNWTDLSGNITATGASTSWTDGAGSKFAQRYYAVYGVN